MVWAYFFGKKDKQKEEEKKQAEQKQTPEQKQKKEAETQWLYEFLIQYLTSPVWKIPIYDFIDQHCIVFDDEEENKFEYTTIHKEFKDLIEAMIQQLFTDIGINENQFAEMAEIGLKNKHHRKIFEQILIVDNFLVFKKLMVKRNKELELEAMKELEKQEKKSSKEIKQKELENEQSELDLAIAVSLAAEKEQQKLFQDEEEQLQQALLQSQLSYNAETAKAEEQKKLQEKALTDSKIAAEKADQEKQQKLADEKLASEKKALDEAAAAALAAKKTQETAKPTETAQPKEETKEDKPVESQTSSKIGGLTSLPPLKANKNLPPLMTKPKYDKPVADLLEQQAKLKTEIDDYKKASDSIKNAKVDTPEETKEDSESIEERKKRLLKQRELLRLKKQKQREEELKRFQELGTTEEVNGDKKQEAIKKQQSIALDIEKTMPESNISAEEKKKRAALYSKIRADLDN